MAIVDAMRRGGTGDDINQRRERQETRKKTGQDRAGGKQRSAIGENEEKSKGSWTRSSCNPAYSERWMSRGKTARDNLHLGEVTLALSGLPADLYFLYLTTFSLPQLLFFIFLVSTNQYGRTLQTLIQLFSESRFLISISSSHIQAFPASTFTMAANGTNDSLARYHAASTEEAIQAEHDYAAHNYHPLPVVFARAQGTSVWDPEGRHYLDFLSAYSAVNQGHCHPKLVAALVDQASRVTLSSRAFYNDVFPRFAEFVTRYFGFDMVLPMNTGAEAVETGIKIARKWGYKVKGIPENEALVLSAQNNFHGRTVSRRLLRPSLTHCRSWLM